MPKSRGQRSEVRASSSEWAGGNGSIHFRAPRKRKRALTTSSAGRCRGQKQEGGWNGQSSPSSVTIPWCNDSGKSRTHLLGVCAKLYIGTDWSQILTVPPTPDPSGQTNMDLRGITTAPGVSLETSIPSSIPTCFCLCSLQTPWLCFVAPRISSELSPFSAHSSTQDFVGTSWFWNVCIFRKETLSQPASS